MGETSGAKVTPERRYIYTMEKRILLYSNLRYLTGHRPLALLGNSNLMHLPLSRTRAPMVHSHSPSMPTAVLMTLQKLYFQPALCASPRMSIVSHAIDPPFVAPLLNLHAGRAGRGVTDRSAEAPGRAA